MVCVCVWCSLCFFYSSLQQQTRTSYSFVVYMDDIFVVLHSVCVSTVEKLFFLKLQIIVQVHMYGMPGMVGLLWIERRNEKRVECTILLYFISVYRHHTQLTHINNVIYEEEIQNNNPVFY